MSVIIYNKGTIYADTKAISDTPATDTYRFMQKIHRSEHGDAAIAYVGDEIAPDSVQGFIDEVVRGYLMSLHGALKPANRLRSKEEGLFKELNELLAGRTVILFLKGNAFVASNYKREIFTHLSDENPSAFGEGEIFVLTAMNDGVTEERAIATYHLIQYGQVDPDFQVSKMFASDLNPLNSENYRLSIEELKAEPKDPIEAAKAEVNDA